MATFQKTIVNALHACAISERRVKTLSRLISAEIKAGRTVLDLGCGDGVITKALISHQPGLNARGIEILPRPQVQIPFDLYDGETIPFSDRSFDWVVIVDVLHHTDNPQAVLTESARVARMGIVVKDHLREGIGAYSTLRFMDWVGNWGHDVRLPYNYLSKTQWTHAIAAAGLSIATWNEKLELYPAPFNWLFGRHLHFIATLQGLSKPLM